MEREAKIATSVRLDEKTLNTIKKTAEKKKRSITQMIRLILEDYCEKIEL